MSASTVRAWFRDLLSPLLAPEGFAFVESINAATATKDLPDQWYTLDFLPSDDQRAALGMPALFRESGACAVLLFVRQNITDASAVAAAEVVRAQCCNYARADVAGHSLRVTEAGPPVDMDGGDFRGAWYGVTVDLRYQFDRIE